MSISTHILDTAKGRPAIHVAVELDRNIDGNWEAVNAAVTDTDGRVKALLPEDEQLLPGLYCIRFATGVYYERERLDGLYPMVEITFRVPPGPGPNHYHIPLLLTANGYTTYRGS
jgi:5-hydroxyisourate hydrolase